MSGFFCLKFVLWLQKPVYNIISRHLLGAGHSMSLLTTFSILFESDAAKASREADELSDSLADVQGSAEGATGGVDGATESYNENAESVGGLTKAMGGMILAYLSFDAIASGVFGNSQSIDSIGKLSQTMGANIVEMDAWGDAIARNGGSAEAFQGTIESLQGSLQEIEITGGGEMINTLAMLGIQATDSGGQIKSAFDILPEVAKSFEGMSAAQSKAFGEQLGFDQGTILTLQQGGEAVDALVSRQKMLSGVTQEGYESAAKFNDQWDDTKKVFNSLWMSANSSILPAFESILKGLEVIVLWVRENQTLVTGFFFAVAGIITAIYLPAIAAAATATLIAAAPFIAIGLAITAVGAAIALLYEDFVKWSEGAPSAIGAVLDAFQGNERQSWRNIRRHHREVEKLY